MPQRIKKLQNKNWNLINILIGLIGILFAALVAIIIAFFTSPSTKELSIIKTENEKFQREINNLKDEIDPSWHEKFNKQKQYYADELSTKDKIINQAEKKVDSFLLNIETTNKNKRVFSIDQLRWIANKLDKGEHDSMELILVNRELEALENLNGIKDSLIKSQWASISSQKNLINNLDSSIELYRLITENYKNKGVRKNGFWDLILIICLVISLILSVFLLFKIKNYSSKPYQEPR